MEPRVQRLARELMTAPLLEGGLLLLTAGFGWAIGRPLLFASLGPTAYEQIEQSDRPSARPYSVVVGHYTAIGAAFLALYAVGAWNAAHMSGAGTLSAPRIWASVIAVALTVLLNLALKASQPAALSTTLLITSGTFQGPQGAVAILIGVAFLALIGEPVRRWRVRQRKKEQQHKLPKAA